MVSSDVVMIFTLAAVVIGGITTMHISHKAAEAKKNQQESHVNSSLIKSIIET